MSEVLRQVEKALAHGVRILDSPDCRCCPGEHDTPTGFLSQARAALAALRESKPSVPVSKLEELADRWENYTDVGPHFRYSRCAAELRALIAEAGQDNGVERDTRCVICKRPRREMRFGCSHTFDDQLRHLEYRIEYLTRLKGPAVVRLAEAGQKTRCGTCDDERYIDCGDGENRHDMPCPACTPQVEEDDGE